MKRYYWEPGNGSRYDLVYGPVDDQRSMVLWLHNGGSGGSALMFDSDGYVHHTYLEEKMDVGAIDGEMICQFLSVMGHAVGIVGDARVTRPPSLLQVETDGTAKAVKMRKDMYVREVI